MCYSAQIRADHRKFERKLGARISLRDFFNLYWLPEQEHRKRPKTPKALDAMFEDLPGADEIRAAIAAWNARELAELEQEVFKQRKRLADAERALATKPTKKAAEDKRIATSKVEWALGRMADIKRTELKDRDGRIYPGWYAPVLVVEHGRRVIKPMRYQCRPGGKPAFYDTKYPGTYNARRDNLEGFWKDLFGYSHGVVLAGAFYENVSRHRVEGRELAPGEKEQNVVLEFRPNTGQDMLVACLWSRWAGPDGEELLSFAAITDAPPPEVAAAGHDRCIIPIKEQHLDAWLNPEPGNRAALYAILDDRERPYYEHRMAA